MARLVLPRSQVSRILTHSSPRLAGHNAFQIQKASEECGTRVHQGRAQRSMYSTTPGLAQAAVASLPSKVSENDSSYLGNQRLISVKGNDATKFLQGLTTNNVLDLGDGETQAVSYNAFLNAQGRIEWDAMLYRYHDKSDDSWSWLVEVDASRRDALWKHLSKHKLRSKVKIARVDRAFKSLAIWGPTTPRQNELTFPDPRLAQLGDRCLILSEADEEADVLTNAQAQYRLRRYLQGIAEGPDEIVPGSALVQESNFDYLAGVDFKKGCYVGQELTIRTQHTGVVRKRILPVQLYTGTTPMKLQYDPEALTPTALEDIAEARKASGPIDIVRAGPGSRRSAGKLLGHVGNIGLALCRLEMMTDLQISAEGGSWQESDEFTLKEAVLNESSGAREVKIKAFIPAWLKEGIGADREKRRARGERSTT